MKNRIKITIRIVLIYLLSISCSKDFNDQSNTPSDLVVQNFIWRGLNTYYLWKENVPDLSDNKQNTNTSLNSFLAAKGKNPEDLFYSLLYQYGTIDRFSGIVDDYTYLENLFAGIEKDNGVNFNLFLKGENSDEIIGIVNYIVPNSDAATKELKRGDIFYAIDGVSLNRSNYIGLLSKDSYTIGLANYDNGKFTPNGKSLQLTSSELTENPVYLKKIITTGDKKVGYLVYNQFITNFEADLNQAFADFSAAGVTDLVLDLRYNPGGSVATATRLGSMITGQFGNEVFVKYKYNKSVQDFFEANDPSSLVDNFDYKLDKNFFNEAPVNSLKLSKIYVLTTKRSASASELIINGLKPFIEVVQIGDVTTGKNAGSFTVYDSPSFGKENRNTSHKYAMQPLIVKIANKNNFGEYESGLQPTVLLKEDKGNMSVLGEETEPLLAKALSMINPQAVVAKAKSQRPIKSFQDIDNSDAMKPYKVGMYID
jgi:carboxyl-terminal processing protease